MRYRIPLLIFIVLFCSSSPVQANAPIGAAMVMAFPLLSTISSLGLTLFLAVLIEGIILCTRLDLEYIEAFKTSLLVNLVSTLAGLGIAIAYSSSFVFLICWILAAIILQDCFVSLVVRTGYFQSSAQIKIISFIGFMGVGMIGGMVGSFLLPLTNEHYRRRAPIPELSETLTALAILVGLGFIITSVIEGSMIARRFHDLHQRIISTVIIMNLFSYMLMLLLSGFDVIQFIAKDFFS